jgi:hypothetical protein
LQELEIMKLRLVSFCLFLSLIVPVLVAYTWLHYKKASVRKEVKWKMIEGIEKDQLVLLKFTTEESQTILNWKHSKEFEFNGEMYDIVSSEMMGDTILYWCWWDHAETRLNKQLDGLVSRVLGGDPKTNENQNRVFSFYKSLFFRSLHEWKPDLAAIAISFSVALTDHISSSFNQPPKPPPKRG